MFDLKPREERPLLPAYFTLILHVLSFGGSTFIPAFQPSLARSLFGVLYYILIFWAVSNLAVDAPWGEIYGAANAACGVFAGFADRVVAASQDLERWHPVPRGRSRQGKEKFVVPRGYWERLKWTWAIVLNPRGAGWSNEVKNLPEAPRAGTGRLLWLARTLLWIVCCILLSMQGTIVLAHALTGGSYVRTSLIDKVPFWRRAIASWAYVCSAYWAISGIGSMPSLIGVALGVWKPEDCPPVFGDSRALYTVRKAWGRVWHQNLRRPATFCGIGVARRLGFRKGSFGSRYTQLFVGFLVTGAVHGIGGYALVGHYLGEWRFFLGQAVAIFVEDHIIAFGNSIGLRGNALWRAIGFLWVVAWYSISIPWWAGPLLQQGLLDKPPDVFGLDAWLSRQS